MAWLRSGKSNRQGRPFLTHMSAYVRGSPEPRRVCCGSVDSPRLATARKAPKSLAPRGLRMGRLKNRAGSHRRAVPRVTRPTGGRPPRTRPLSLWREERPCPADYRWRPDRATGPAHMLTLGVPGGLISASSRCASCYARPKICFCMPISAATDAACKPCV